MKKYMLEIAKFKYFYLEASKFSNYATFSSIKRSIKRLHNH